MRSTAAQTPGTNGKAEYQFGASDLSGGTLKGEVRIQPGLSDQITSLEPFYLPIRSALS
jgi:hypothetical protein